ncbi:MAG: ribosome recycling factor [Verrucomicrobiales bacterium]|nr:ribosome recycling factor [Verrucomicrobiales bacterium]|tara:strand:+ start:335 stop:895 length:561 start_codon:yes stop_codon:yes gene_type:complete
MPVDDVLLETEDKMQKSEEVVQREFAGVRTGKASPGLVENLQVECYGTQMRLKELANISAPEPRLLVVTPFDASNVSAVEKAIQKANLGLNPAIDGKLIRLVLPELSEERRQEYVKHVKKMAEDGRVAVRHVRRDALTQLKAESKSGEITEDDLSKGEKDVQKLTDDFVKKIDEALEEKEKEIMTV